MFGELSNVKAGTEFDSRKLASAAGVHRPPQGGICGTKLNGAESIVLSGGYKDDEDHGDVIIYTGHGGQDDKGNQISDQSLDDTGNAALVTSHLEGLPVRVVRGWRSGSPYAPKKGYRYDGLYRVTSYGKKLGIDGFLIWQFRLEAYEGTPTPEHQQEQLPTLSDLPHQEEDAQAPKGNEKPERMTSTVQRVIRSSAVKRKVKQWHDDQCQICDTRIETPGGNYSEGAHIQALGSPHDGPDVTSNVLCLCPNCHTMVDLGAIVFTDDLTVMRGGEAVGNLRTHPKHTIDLNCVKQQRERWGQ